MYDSQLRFAKLRRFYVVPVLIFDAQICALNYHGQARLKVCNSQSFRFGRQRFVHLVEM